MAREGNGASLEGEERGAGVFLGRGGGDELLEEEKINFFGGGGDDFFGGGGDELLEEEKINFCCTQPTKLLHTILQSCVEVSENKLLLEHTCC